MKAVLQRVARASAVPGGSIGAGVCILVGVADGDVDRDAVRLAERAANLRIFPNEQGKFDRSLLESGGAALVVSQFTLLADATKGNRPSFAGAARPEAAEPIYDLFCATLRSVGVPVETGVFGAHMAIELVNDGPVTIILE